MRIQIDRNGEKMSADTNKPLHLSIPLINDVNKQPNAYGAPPFEIAPYQSGNFIGSLDAGSPVNFFNIRVNPHGNGTHTESVGHIAKGNYPIHECLRDTFIVAELVTVHPTKHDNGDRVIQKEVLETMRMHDAEALIVRTLPNEIEKRHRQYTGTNPPYFSAEAMQWIHGQNYSHLLVDLPSVDREEDGGELSAHKIFWQVNGEIRTHRTITEMIFVDNVIRDGLYLLNLQVAPLILDASPSRPVLFKLEKD